MDVTIKDVGPIDNLKLTMPPGVTVLRGKNGAGKTTALKAVRALATKNASDLEHRDRTISGKVEGLGCTLTIGQRRKHSGELEVMSIEGKFDLGGLVDPGYQDPLAADRARIKTLMAMAGTPVGIAAFYVCCDGTAETFHRLVAHSTLQTTDPIELARLVKRDLEDHARKLEDDQAKAQAAADAKAAVFVNLDEATEFDAMLLQEKLEHAVAAKAAAQERVESWQKSCNQASDAEPRLAALRRDYEGPTLGAATEAATAAETAWSSTNNAVIELERALREARHAQELAKERMLNAQSQQRTAEQHEKQVAGLLEIINSSSSVEAPPHDELPLAEDRLRRAREAVENGARVRDAIRAKQDHAGLIEKIERLKSFAKSLRDGAKLTDEILAQHLPACGLKVLDGRLVVETAARGETYFADLSHGEKWSLAVQIAQGLGGEEHFLTIDQEAWESLDYDNRALIATRAQELGARILTAEADHDADSSGELRAEQFQPPKET